MSKYNNYANEDKYRGSTQQWIQKNCPLLYVFARSNKGKTTLIGSLFPAVPGDKTPLWTFQHTDYTKVLYIDGDQGSATIEHLVGDERLCELLPFDKEPDQLLAWMYKALEYAKQADVNAIVVEGLTATHRRLVADELRANPGATGNKLKRCYIAASSHAAALIDTVRQIKQYRISKGTGVPIVVILNAKSEPLDSSNPDAGDRTVPTWSPNLIGNAMEGSDMHAQLTRDATGTRLITLESPQFPYCKMRNSAVAEAVMRELNLSLPGLFTLWAVTAKTQRKKARAAMDKRDNKEQNTNPDESTPTGAES